MSVSLYDNENFLNLCNAFSEYSYYFENDVMLNFITVNKKKDKKIIHNIDIVIHNQCEKMRLYNFMFYKLFISKNYTNVTLRLKEVKNMLNLVFKYNKLFMTINITNFEKIILERPVSKKSLSLKLNFLDEGIDYSTTSLKSFGYSIKNTQNKRILALEYAIKYYGLERVYNVLKKIQYLNSVLKEDFDYINKRYHLFPAVFICNTESCVDSFYDIKDYCDYKEVQEGMCPQHYKLDPCEISIGTPSVINYDNFSYLNGVYFNNFLKKLDEYKEYSSVLSDFCYDT